MSLPTSKLSSNSPGKNEPAPQQHRFYIWQLAGKPILIHLRLDVVERLREELLLASSEEVPSDICGILLGRRLADPARPTVLVDDYELVRAGEDGAFGINRSALAEIVRRWPPGGEQYAIGLIRSQREAKIRLREDEIDAAKALFPARDNIFLVIRASSNLKHLAGFFFWENDTIRAHESYQEFAFQADQDAHKRERVARIAAVGRKYERWLRGRNAIRIGSAPAAALLLLLVVAKSGLRIFGIKGSVRMAATEGTPAIRPASSSIAAPFGLDLSLDGELIKIAWNKGSPLVLSAERGTLTILDGVTARQIQLTRDQLMEGHIYYGSPMAYTLPSGNISVSFETFDSAGRSASESIGSLADPNLRFAVTHRPANTLQTTNPSFPK